MFDKSNGALYLFVRFKKNKIKTDVAEDIWRPPTRFGFQRHYFL